MTDVQQQDEINIFCDLSVFTDAVREKHLADVEKLFGEVTELRESDAGYLLRLPDTVGMLLRLADFIEHERQCCAFIHYAVEVEQNSKAIWLILKGGATVKAAIREEMLRFLPDDVASNKTNT